MLLHPNFCFSVWLLSSCQMPYLGILYLTALWVLPLLRNWCCRLFSVNEIWFGNCCLESWNGAPRALSALSSLPTWISEAIIVKPLGFQGAKSKIHFSISIFFPFIPKTVGQEKWEDIWLLGKKREMQDKEKCTGFD